MMDNPSSILDPVTGNPLDQFSGIIQQIPLGLQIFPFEDLDADGRMTRQPIYGDDVLPASALVVGHDPSGRARAGTMDTARRLYTREAVFQNLGNAIPDGTTAPVDVNVVSSSGGGGGSISPNFWRGPSDQIVDDGATDDMVDGPFADGSRLYSVDVSAVLDPNVGGIPPTVGYGFLYIFVTSFDHSTQFYLGSLAFYWNTTNGGTETLGHFAKEWQAGLSFTDLNMPAARRPNLTCTAHNGPYRVFANWLWKVP